ncbi:hypothetical protein NKH91_29170 [Mesorhizobium sp. M0894]|uniref:hypothetical protein n=1 Tax=unclassified Mesorhizobium TaxID=325217 RepID=UPI00333A64CF
MSIKQRSPYSQGVNRGDAQIAGGLGSMMDASMSGHVGNVDNRERDAECLCFSTPRMTGR